MRIFALICVFVTCVQVREVFQKGRLTGGLPAWWSECWFWLWWAYWPTWSWKVKMESRLRHDQTIISRKVEIQLQSASKQKFTQSNVWFWAQIACNLYIFKYIFSFLLRKVLKMLHFLLLLPKIKPLSQDKNLETETVLHDVLIF